MLALAVLGPFELRRDGELLSVPAGKTTELLIRLAVDAGVPVRVEGLMEDLWGSDGAATHRNTLQAKVSKLRRALGDAAVISASAGGYALEVDPGAVDAFEAAELGELGELASTRLAATWIARALFVQPSPLLPAPDPGPTPEPEKVPAGVR